MSIDGFQIGDYFHDHETELLVDFIQRFPEVWVDWVDIKYGDKPEPENSYETFLADIECSQFKQFSDWAVSYIKDLLDRPQEEEGEVA